MSFKFCKNIVNRIPQLSVYIFNYLKKSCKDIAHWRWIIFINVSQKKNPCVSGQELSLLKSFQGKKKALPFSFEPFRRACLELADIGCVVISFARPLGEKFYKSLFYKSLFNINDLIDGMIL